MGDIATIIVLILFLVLGILIGNRAGGEFGKRAITKRDYWLYNLAILGIGMLFVVLMGLFGLVLIEATGLGFMAGGLLGLKMEFGESVGPWKIHDKVFRVNKAQQKTAEEGTGEARRRRKREGGEEPQLISVDSTKVNSSNGTRNTR